MRIISGKNRGKKIIIPKNLPVRPTTDQSKEAVFNIINNSYYFEDLNVLDLFSGSGNISYEFASRGVKNIRCVDNNSNCTMFINKISNELNFNLKVTKNSTLKYLTSCLEQFDIIFFDPPRRRGGRCAPGKSQLNRHQLPCRSPASPPAAASSFDQMHLPLPLTTGLQPTGEQPVWRQPKELSEGMM